MSMNPNDGWSNARIRTLEEDRQALRTGKLGDGLLEIADAHLQGVRSFADAQVEEVADVEREDEAGARRVRIVRVEALHVVARHAVAVGVAAQQKAAIVRRQIAHAVDEQLDVGDAARIDARAEVESPAADGLDERGGTNRRRDDRRAGVHAALRAVQHGVAERLVDVAERLEVLFAVEDLDLAAADQARHAEAIGGAHFEKMHTVLNARRVDVGDESAEERSGKVGERRADVGTRVAVHRGLQVAAVDLHVDAGDAVRIRGPADDRERSAGVEDGVAARLIDRAERRLIERVVDVDRAATELLDPSVAHVDAKVNRVRTVREPAGQESGRESGRAVMQAGIVRVGLDDIDARQSRHCAILKLIVDEELDLCDLRRIECPSSDENDAALNRRGIRKIKRSDEARLGK